MFCKKWKKNLFVKTSICRRTYCRWKQLEPYNFRPWFLSFHSLLRFVIRTCIFETSFTLTFGRWLSTPNGMQADNTDAVVVVVKVEQTLRLNKFWCKNQRKKLLQKFSYNFRFFMNSKFQILAWCKMETIEAVFPHHQQQHNLTQVVS